MHKIVRLSLYIFFLAWLGDSNATSLPSTNVDDGNYLSCNYNEIDISHHNWEADIAGYYQKDDINTINKWRIQAEKDIPKFQFYMGNSYQLGDIVTADQNKSLYWYRRAVANNYPVAMNNLALLYESGQWVDQNYSMAFKLMCNAAQQGVGISQFNIGRYYHFGIATNPNGKQAKKWYEKASKNGHIGSNYGLALMYIDGILIDKDIDKAIQLIESDAERHFPPAMFDVGNIYLKGIAREVDIDKSILWFKQACDSGYAESCNQLGMMREDGVGLEVNYDEAMAFYNKASGLGSPMGDNNIGSMYLNGRGVPKDYGKAFKMFTIASKSGITTAIRNLGVMYQNGWGVDVDHNKAIELFTKASSAGNIESMFNLAYVYDYGIGVDTDKKMAFYWYKNAAENGHGLSQVKVGYMYKNGIGVGQSYKRARYWYEISSEHGDEFSLYNLADIYRYGFETDIDINKAEKYYKKSADMGLNLAQYQLGKLYLTTGRTEEAIKWYEIAGENGHSYAQMQLGDAYSTKKSDFGEIEDFRKAEYWYIKAIKQGEIEAIASLGWIYVLEYDYLGRKRELFNPKKGIKLLNKASDLGSKRVPSYLSYVYEFGVGVDRDVNKSLNISLDRLNNNILNNDKIKLLIDVFEAQVDSQAFNNDTLYTDDVVNIVFPYLIESARAGNIDHQILLGRAYLSPTFKYNEIDEGLFWMNKAATKSIEANEQLVLNHFGFDGMSFDLNLVLGTIDNTIDLYESGKAVDIEYYRNHGLFQIIDLYHRGAELNISFGRKDIAESMLRRASAIHLSENSIRYTDERKIIMALMLSKNGDNNSAMQVLKDVISNNKIAESDYYTLSNHIKAAQHYSTLLYQSGKKEMATDILSTVANKLDESSVDQATITTWRKMLYLVLSEHHGLMNNLDHAKYYLSMYNNMKQDEHLVDLFDLMEQMASAIIYAQQGDYTASYNILNDLMLLAKSREIPVTEDQNLTIGTISSIMASNNRFDLAFQILDEYINLYSTHAINIVKSSGETSFSEKIKIKNLVSNYIHYSEQATRSDISKSFESMQLVSGLTVSDSLVKSLMRSNISKQESILRKKIEDLLNSRRSLLHKKYKNINNTSLTLEINDKLNKIDNKIQAYRSDLINITTPGSLLDEYIVSTSTIQKNISINDALITMLVSDHRTYIWLVTKDEIFRHKSPLVSSDVSRIVHELKTSLDPSNLVDSYTNFPFHSSNILYDELIRPFEDNLSNIDRLLIVPDSELSNIPLTILTRDAKYREIKAISDLQNKNTTRGIGAIHINNTYNGTNKDSSWLINKYAISTIPSVYSYSAYNSVKKYSSLSNFFGIGNPTLHGNTKIISPSDMSQHLDTRGSNAAYSLASLSSLPETKKELEEIASYFDNSLILSGDDATEKNLRSTLLRDYDVLSFATHALVANEISGLVEPSLVLTPNNFDIARNDGLLTMSEVAKLDLDADIVLLSACNTASSYSSSSSEGLSGLANSFFQAGAKSLLVSYWSVISESAVDLTTRMFKPANDGRSYAHKHQNAVLDLLRNSKDSSKLHPSYWAPFSVIGVY